MRQVAMWLSAAAIGTMVAAGSASAQQGQGPGQGMMMGPGGGMGPGMRMMRVDLDQDGIITADEAAAWHESVFAAMDEDGDEVVTREEFLAAQMGMGPGTGPRAAMREQRRGQRFDMMDADSDGKLTLDEFLDQAQATFAAADQDGDGKVSTWEFRAARRW
jgi:Ca2+-binding EF-hand superfamily protein